MDLKDKKALLHQKVFDCGLKPQIDYHNLYQDIRLEYKYNTRLSLSSLSYDLKLMSPAVQDKAQTLLQDKCFIMFVIDAMSLEGVNGLPYRLYHELYKDNPELFLSTWEAYRDDLLFKEYDKRGIADMNTEIWLNSALGESYLFDKQEGEL